MLTLEQILYMPIPMLKILLFPFGFDFRPDLSMLIMIKYVAIISGIFAIIGFLTNISLAVFVYTNLVIITHFYSYSDFHHTEAPLILALAYLTLSPAGRVLSVDRLLRGKGSGVAACWMRQAPMRAGPSSWHNGLSRWSTCPPSWKN